MSYTGRAGGARIALQEHRPRVRVRAWWYVAAALAIGFMLGISSAL